MISLLFTGGQWVHENRNVRLNNGDTVYYWLYMLVNGRGRQVTGQKLESDFNLNLFLYTLFEQKLEPYEIELFSSCSGKD
jgi:hypothetical protein